MFGKKQIIMIIAIVAAVLVAAAVVLLTLPTAPSTVPSDESSMDLSNEPSSDLSDELSSSTVDVLAPHIGIRASFTSTVYNIRNNRLLTSANGALCWVSTDVRSDVPVPLLRVGDPVKVVYDGKMAESFPGQINVVYEIKKRDGAFPMLTYKFLPKVSVQKKLTQIVEQDGELGCAIYYYGLDGMDVTFDGQTMSLQQALGMGLVSTEYWLSQAQRDAQSGKCKLTEYKDGGSKLYRYDNYAILKMNTIDGDKTLYIGSADMTIEAANGAEADDAQAAPYTLCVKKTDFTALKKVTRAQWGLDYDVYYYGIDSAEVKVDEETTDLLEAVSRGKLTFDDLLADAEAQGDRIYHTMYRDGGSMLYRFDEYAILKRNTLSGDKTLYIGITALNPSMVNNVAENSGFRILDCSTDREDVDVNICYLNFDDHAPKYITVIWENFTAASITYGAEYHLYRYDGNKKIDCCADDAPRLNVDERTIYGKSAQQEYLLDGFALSEAGKYSLEFSFSVSGQASKIYNARVQFYR